MDVDTLQAARNVLLATRAIYRFLMLTVKGLSLNGLSFAMVATATQQNLRSWSSAPVD